MTEKTAKLASKEIQNILKNESAEQYYYSRKSVGSDDHAMYNRGGGLYDRIRYVIKKKKDDQNIKNTIDTEKVANNSAAHKEVEDSQENSNSANDNSIILNDEKSDDENEASITSILNKLKFQKDHVSDEEWDSLYDLRMKEINDIKTAQQTIDFFKKWTLYLDDNKYVSEMHKLNKYKN